MSHDVPTPVSGTPPEFDWGVRPIEGAANVEPLTGFFS